VAVQEIRIPVGEWVTGERRAKLAGELAKRYREGASIRKLQAETGRSYGWVHRVLGEQLVEFRARCGAPPTRSSTRTPSTTTLSTLVPDMAATTSTAPPAESAPTWTLPPDIRAAVEATAADEDITESELVEAILRSSPRLRRPPA